MNKSKVEYDWPAIQLASLAYKDDLNPGTSIFKSHPDWKLLEKYENKQSGLLAYTFVNVPEKRIVVAIQGSRNPLEVVIPSRGSDVVRDWSQDAKAIGAGTVPSQFKLAEQYVSGVQQKYGSRFSVDCSGHSMGGGACVYAASNISNIHAIAIDPISSNSLVTKNAYLIDNYIARGSAPDIGHVVTQRGMTGWKYNVTDEQFLVSQNSGTSQSTSAWVSPLGNNLIERHSLERQIDAIGAEVQLNRYELLPGL